MKYLLDTNTCIFLMKNMSEVVERFNEKKQSGIVISSITAAELLYGVYKSDYVEKNRMAFLNFISGIRIIDFDGNAADTYGIIRAYLQKKGIPIGNMDTLIAAHALTEKLILVTNNTREFERVPNLVIEDWKDN